MRAASSHESVSGEGREIPIYIYSNVLPSVAAVGPRELEHKLADLVLLGFLLGLLLQPHRKSQHQGWFAWSLYRKTYVFPPEMVPARVAIHVDDDMESGHE
jgi:hypothetical protein